MPYDEFQNWLLYFDKRPIGWRDDLRTAYLLKNNGDKRSPLEIFPTLSAVFSKKEQTAGKSLVGSNLLNKLMSSKSGKILSIEND